MGERTQLYVHFKKENKERLLGYHHQWLYDKYAIIRTYQFLKFVSENLKENEFSPFRNTRFTYRKGEDNAIAKALFSFSIEKSDYNPCGNLIDDYQDYEKEEEINPLNADSDHGFIVFDIHAEDKKNKKGEFKDKIKFAFCKFKGWNQIETMGAKKWHEEETKDYEEDSKDKVLDGRDLEMANWIDDNFEVMTPEEVFNCFGPLKDMYVDFDKLEPVTEITFKNISFKEVVSRLQRPYIRLSSEEYEKVKSIGTDVVKYKGRYYTFGDYDGGKIGLMRYLP